MGAIGWAYGKEEGLGENAERPTPNAQSRMKKEEWSERTSDIDGKAAGGSGVKAGTLKHQLRRRCSSKESIDYAMFGERWDAAGIGEPRTGDEFVEHLRTARISAKPVIAKLRLDKFDFSFAQQIFRSREYVRLEPINVDLKIIDTLDLMSGRYLI